MGVWGVGRVGRETAAVGWELPFSPGNPPVDRVVGDRSCLMLQLLVA